MSGASRDRDGNRPGPLPQADEYVARLVTAKARQLIRTAGFRLSDREDIEQDLTVHLLEHLPEYDPARSSLHTFMDRLVENAAADLIRYRMAGMRDPRRLERSLDEPVTDAEGRQADVASTLAGSGKTPGELRDAAVDLARAMDKLEPRLRLVCERLPVATPQEIADELGVTRRTVYRWIGEIRALFEEAGLGDYA